MDAPTVANKFADLIIDLECQQTNFQKISDPEDIFYSDDEIVQSEDEEDVEEDDKEDYVEEIDGGQDINLSLEEKILVKRIKSIGNISQRFLLCITENKY